MDLQNAARSLKGDNEILRRPFELELPDYLSTAYEVLRRIFSFLPLEDIENVGIAIKSWKPMVKITREERRCVESFIVSEPRYKMTKVWGEANFCICFSTGVNKEVNKKITEYLAPNADFCECLAGAGIIGTVNDLSQLVQQKVRIGIPSSYMKYYFSVLRIPSMPKVGIKTMLWEDGMDFVEFRKSFDIPRNEIVKCVIILMVTDGSVLRANVQKNDFIYFLQTRQRPSFALGGSVIDGFGDHADSGPNAMVKYIIFYGDNIEAASTVLTAEVKSLGGVNSKVKKLKEMCPTSKKGALFVFRCAGRQRVIKRTKFAGAKISKWEGDSIQKYFPGTPVVGCYGYGEFGREHPVAEEDSFSAKRPKLFNWEYSFSTSIVYVGFHKK